MTCTVVHRGANTRRLLAAMQVLKCRLSTIRLSRPARCVAYPYRNNLKKSSRLRVSENKRKLCFQFVEREQSQLEIKAIMQGRTDYENMLPMTIGIKK